MSVKLLDLAPSDRDLILWVRTLPANLQAHAGRWIADGSYKELMKLPVAELELVAVGQLMALAYMYGGATALGTPAAYQWAHASGIEALTRLPDAKFKKVMSFVRQERREAAKRTAKA
jgi:hypothetical protein